MANRADRMLKTFETGFGAGQAIGKRMWEGRKETALSEAEEAQTGIKPQYKAPTAGETGAPALPAGIPAQGQQGSQLGEQWMSDEQYTLTGRQEFGNDLLASRKRRQQTLTEAAKYLKPSEMESLEKRYNTKQKDDYRMGLSTAAAMLKANADPGALAEHLTNTWALNPTGTSGVASVIDGEVVMSFFDENTGEVKGTVPMNDPDFLMKQAAAFDDPQWAKNFDITERKMTDAEERTDILMDNHMLNVEKEGNDVAYKQYNTARQALADDQSARNSVATAWAKQDKKVKSRAEAVDKRVSSHMKDGQDQDGVPYNTFGNRMGFHATATGIGVMNPGMMGAQPLVATQEILSIQQQVAEDIMQASGGDERYEDWQRGMPIPQELLTQSYQAMLATKDNPNAPIRQEMGKDGKPTGQVYYQMGNEKVYLPPIVTGNGQPMSHIGMIYKATDGGGIYSEAEKANMRNVVNQGVSGQAPGGPAPAPRTTTVGGVSGGGVPAPPSSQSAQPAPQQVGAPAAAAPAQAQGVPAPAGPGSAPMGPPSHLARPQQAMPDAPRMKATQQVVDMIEGNIARGIDPSPQMITYIMNTPGAFVSLSPVAQQEVKRVSGQ